MRGNVRSRLILSPVLPHEEEQEAAWCRPETVNVLGDAMRPSDIILFDVESGWAGGIEIVMRWGVWDAL